MKRVILFDLDAATLDDINELKEELKKKKAELEKKQQEAQDDIEKKEYYDAFIDKAIDIYTKTNKKDKDEYFALRSALCTAYEKEGNDVWIEFDANLRFGDSPPCMVDDGWCSGNLDRLSGLTFLYNRFNSDWVICNVCLESNRNVPDFDEVFVEVDDVIDDMENKIEKKNKNEI